MNCDQVFDVLTQGPFPRGRADDSQVEAHLAGCDECRRLALALRPAVTLFHETLSEDEAACLPGYWGDLLEGAPAAAPQRAASAGCDSARHTEVFAAGVDPASSNAPPSSSEHAAPEEPLYADQRAALPARDAAAGRPGIGVRAGRKRLLRRTLAAVCLAAAGGAAFLPTTPSSENGKGPLASRPPRFTAPAPRVVEGDLLWAAAGVPNCAATTPSEGFAFVDVPADGPGAPLAAAAWRPQTVAFQGPRAAIRVAQPPRAVIFAALSGPSAASPVVHPGRPRDAALLALYCCTHCHKESSPALLTAAAPVAAANVERAQACLLCHDSEP